MKLENCVDILSGFAFKSKFFNTEEKGLPIIRIRDVTSNSVSTYYNGEYKEEYVIKNGDILIGMDGNFNLIEWQGGKALLNQRVCKLIPKKDKVEKDFIKFLVPKSLKEIEDKTSFVTVKHLSVKKIKEIELPNLSLKTQQYIASILDDAAVLRYKTARLIKDYKLLAQSIFLEMFGDPFYNTKNLKRSTIGEVANIVGGSQPPKKYFKNEPTKGYVRLVQIRDYKSDRFLTFVPEKSTKKFCTEEDIMIGRYGPPVFQILRGISGAYNVALMKATPRKIIHKEYLFYLLSSSYVQGIIIGNSQRTAGQTGVNLKLLNKIEVNLPPIELQNQFAEKIAIIEQQKKLAKQELQESEDLFNCLLQKAFKGELKK